MQYKNTEKFTTEVIDEVEEVQKNYGLTANNLLKKASKKSSSLYGFFDWDNSSAGDKWRLNQARQLINEIKVIVKDKEIYAFENVNVTVEDKKDKKIKLSLREYKPIIEVMNNDYYRKQIIQRALSEAKYWKERHSELVELKSIFLPIDIENKKWQTKK
jgi:hypothetical protein